MLKALWKQAGAKFCEIPRGAVIGFNPDEDRKRHTVTDLGVVVVTEDDDPLVEPISDEALRIEAEDDGR